MAKFFVGQRVRVVRTDFCHECLGREATIIAFDSRAICFSTARRYQGYDVCVDGIGAISKNGGGYCFGADQLEPLTPSGHAPAELTVHELLPFLTEREAA